MPGMTMRDFECALCQERFEMLGGYLMVPQLVVCNACLRKTWPLDGEALATHVAHYLAKEASISAKDVLSYIQAQKAQWASLEEALWWRGEWSEPLPPGL